MPIEDIQIESVEVVDRLDNVWVHFHLAGPFPERPGATVTVEAVAHDGSTQLVGVALNHPDPSLAFVSGERTEREVVSVGTAHMSDAVLTVAFPAAAFTELGADPMFTVRVETDDDGHDIDVPVTVTQPPITR